MNQPSPTELPIPAAASGSRCGGGNCGCGSASDRTHQGTDRTTAPEKENPMTDRTTRSFQVTGMTCGHCASAVTDEITQLPGVSAVAVNLVAGGTSTVRVTGTEPLDDASVARALQEAGEYQLV